MNFNWPWFVQPMGKRTTVWMHDPANKRKVQVADASSRILPPETQRLHARLFAVAPQMFDLLDKVTVQVGGDDREEFQSIRRYLENS